MFVQLVELISFRIKNKTKKKKWKIIYINVMKIFLWGKKDIKL